MEKIIKTFNGGLNTDDFKQNEQPNEYSYAENIRLTGGNAQDITIENVRGNKIYANIHYCEKQIGEYGQEYYITKTKSINGNFYSAIGYCTVKDIAIILITNGTTGDILIHKPSYNLPETHLLYSVLPKKSNLFSIQDKYALALGYDKEYHDTYAEIRSDGKIYYYIGGRNNRKSRAIILSPSCPVCEKTVINSQDPDTILFDYYLDSAYTEDNFDSLTTIIPYSKDPIIHLKGYNHPVLYYLAGIENSGNLESGTWKYSVRYIDAFGNKTNWSPISQEIPIYDEPLFQDRGINWNKVYGTSSGNKCRKTVTLEIKNIDANFAYIELAGILNQDGIETAYIIKTEPLTNNTTMVIKHTGNETYLPIDLAELTVKKVNIFNFETLKSIDNYLFIAGIKETLLTNYLPLQEIADKIQLRWKTYTIPESEGTFSTFSGNANFPDCRPKIGNYKIPYNCYYRLGYFRDDDYSFGIQFKLKDGSYTPVFPIGKADFYTTMPNLFYNALEAGNLGHNGNTSDCNNSMPPTYGHQQLYDQYILLHDVPYDNYNINIASCSIDKNFSYYKEGAYIYRSPAHIENFEIIDGRPRLASEQSADYLAYPLMQNKENKYAIGNMGKPRYVRVLYPEFYNIQIPIDSNIEGYYILRTDRKKYGRIKSTGVSCISIHDYPVHNALTSGNSHYQIPPTPTFLNYLTQYGTGASDSNCFKIAGCFSNHWAPVFGYWSFDEIYAKDEYRVIPYQDILEHIYVNLPLHANYDSSDPSPYNSCGYPRVTSNGYPVTESNYWVMANYCTGIPEIADQSTYTEEWFKRLYLLLWCGYVFSPPNGLPHGHYTNTLDATVLYAEVNMWQKIQNKEWNSTHKGICRVINYADAKMQGDGYEFITDNCNPDWQSFFNPSGNRIRIDLTTQAPVHNGDCGVNGLKARLFIMHPCKLIQVGDYLGFLYGVQSGYNTTPSTERVSLGGRGLIYYSQIRRLKHSYVAPIYREYMYATLYQPVENNENVQYNYITTANNEVTHIIHNNLAVFGGDCYIGKYYLQMQRRDVSPLNETLANNHDGILQGRRYRTTHVSVYAESMHNISLIHVLKNENGAVLNYGHFPYLNRADIDERRENAELFATEGTEYNLGYTTYKNTFAQAVKEFSNEEDITLYQIRYSLKQLDILKEDQYRIFLANNFADAIRRFGKIVKLENLNESLIIGQEDGIGMYRVSQAAQVPSTAGEIQLAVSDVLSNKPEYYTKENEIGVQDLFGIYNADNTLYVFDKKRKQIVALSQGGLDVLSKSRKINSIIKSLVYEIRKSELPVFISKNRYHDEIVFKLVHSENYPNIDVPFYETSIPDVLVYNARLGKFVSFLTYRSDLDYSLNDRYYGFGKDNITENLVLCEYNIGRRGEFFSKIYNAKIKHNVITKTVSTFDSIKIVGNSEYIDKQYRVFKDRIEVFPIRAFFRTSYQYGYKEFINNYNIRDILFSQQYNVPIDNILYKEQVWHTDFPFAIPENNTDWKEILFEKNLMPEYYSEERLRDFYCEVLWELNNGADYDPNSQEYLIYGNKRYRWLYLIYLINASSI